eukprot:NODE_7859_length_1544_cov_3.856740.p1 GENE.NODE_7859_length_1544_cov_3.856740~~NODE_7859_length_1544_cov_3.856740.p1  ORF type:complete len:251 (+),score=42.06 NODE_7859_length_1544_cov_3.856740:565-1317(+)
MNILTVRVDTGEIVGNKTVTFGAMGRDVQSEQRITVFDGRAAVVNNWIADGVPWVCRFITRYLSAHRLARECVFLAGVMPKPGVQQFAIDPNTGTLSERWSRNDVQCSSSIPADSAGGGGAVSGAIFYCVGQRAKEPEYNNIFERLLAPLLPRTIFTLEALDWETGATDFSLDLGGGFAFNPAYAGVVVGSQDDVVFGTMAGVVRVAYGEPVPPSPPRSFSHRYLAERFLFFEALFLKLCLATAIEFAAR